MLKLKCMCCGFECEFADGEAAFQAGWDAPPYFTGHIACDLCPAVCIVLGRSHEKAHALWAKEGRPKEFTVKTCGDDSVFGSAAQREHDILMKAARKGPGSFDEFAEKIRAAPSGAKKNSN